MVLDVPHSPHLPAVKEISLVPPKLCPGKYPPGTEKFDLEGSPRHICLSTTVESHERYLLAKDTLADRTSKFLTF
jgi:hypothetical protein